jgi:putative acyl-CoA dehydrogenase
VSTIIEMVNHTRLDCAIASAGLMRQALVQALHHCRHRKAFGKLLIEQPLMRQVLADLTVESEAATLLVARLAKSFDDREHSSQADARAFSRIATAICKYWLCKRSPVHVGEALECLGGNGYVEESLLPRLYREAPLYGIWEGSGNVICLDILRALAKDPGTAEALLAELKATAGADPRLDRFSAAVQSDLSNALNRPSSESAEIEGRARWLAERLALALQASLVVRHGRAEVAEAFLASRIAGDHGHNFGTLPAGINVGAILEGA